MREDTLGREGGGESEMVLWRPSRHGVRSGQGGLRVLQMCLKSGGVPAVLSGVMISMGRTLEKLGPALYLPECVERLSEKPWKDPWRSPRDCREGSFLPVSSSS
jgi:hypothetical protein